MSRPKALREVTQFDYVLKDNKDDDPEEQVHFTLTGLTGRDRAAVRQLLLGSSDGKTADLAAAYEASEAAVAMGLKGWTDNYTSEDKAGNDVEVKWPGNGRKALKLLPEATVQELSLEIMKASELAEDERGN